MPPRIPCQASTRLAATPKRGRIATTTTKPTLTPPRCIAATRLPSTTRHYAAASSSLISAFKLPDDYVPPTKPPSARPSHTRKSQLLRSYTSLLRSTPVMLLFQHNNLTSHELSAIRRELRAALAAVPLPASPDGSPSVDFTRGIMLQVVRMRMLNQALKIVEFYDPTKPAPPTLEMAATGTQKSYTHDLSWAAYDTVKAFDGKFPESSLYAELGPLMSGPIAALTFPAVSPQHLAAALSVLAPSPPAFPAPTRKKRPGYWEPQTQSGLQKLLLIGGRIEGRALDNNAVKWVGGIKGGLDGLRSQLVTMLQSAGMGLTTTLEGAGKSLWLTMEGRRTMLEDAEKEGETKGEEKKE